MKFRHCLLKILENQNGANGQMEALTDGCEKVYPPPPHAQFAGGIMKKNNTVFFPEIVF